MRAPVRIVCLRCAERYARVVDPDCPLCSGRGTVAAVVSDRVEPWTAARALGLHLGDYWVDRAPPTDRVRAARRLPLLVDDEGKAEGLRDQPTDRMAAGRAAGAWLLAVGLRKRKPRNLSKRRATAEERRQTAEARRKREERQRAFEQERKRKRIEDKALQALRSLHPEEFDEMVEREGPLLVIEEMWWA